MTLLDRRLRGITIGAGYFSRFHLEAWARIPEVELTAVCDLDATKAEEARTRFGPARCYLDAERALDAEKPDFVDIATPPATHRDLCKLAFERGIPVICQKPLAPTLDEARSIVELFERSGVRLMVHENFRFQPWHREIKRILDSGEIGRRLHALTFRSRPGDGWGADAYVNRQPYFREMPRFLIHETGIHFIDTFRFLAGEVASVFARLRKLNPEIAGEDCGLILLEFESGAVGVWDANRYNESECDDPRFTFGEFLVETDGGSIRLACDGAITTQRLGEKSRVREYSFERRGFGGDCVYLAQRHFIEKLNRDEPFETEGRAYLENLYIQESLYKSAAMNTPVAVTRPRPALSAS